MFAFLSAPDSSDRGAPEVRIAEPKPADLIRTTELGSGISVEIDLADPERWHSVTVQRWEQADLDLLELLIGPDAVRRLGELRSSARSSLGAEVSLDVVPTGPWQRIAVIDALDWWLQLPLEQALLDAERAVAQVRAAASLRPGPLRQQLTEQALVLARGSAAGFAGYLTELADSASSLPRALFSGLSRLAAGYAILGREVVDGPDNDLDLVAAAWSRLQAAVRVVPTFKPQDHSVSYRLSGEPSAGGAVVSSSVDPRQVRARIVDTDVLTKEVRMMRSDEGSAIRVMVPAFGPSLPAAVISDRLMVRLVDSRSGTAYEPVLLTLRSGRAAESLGATMPVFTELVPLRGAPLEDLRADVFEADNEAAPARSDTDSGLLRQRRAQFVLGEWRRAAAEARLSRGVKVRNRRLARLVDVLSQTTADADQPVFLGGPSPAEIVRLIDTADSPAANAIHLWFASSQGAGEPLVAELAAVYAGR